MASSLGFFVHLGFFFFLHILGIWRQLAQAGDRHGLRRYFGEESFGDGLRF